MHVVGARFRALPAAAAALLAVRDAVRVARGDVGVRPLGSTRYEMPAEDFLLAGRFDEGDVEAVVAIIERHGGHVIERRPDVPVRRPAGSGVPGGSRVSSETRPHPPAPWEPAQRRARPANPAARPRTAARIRKRPRRPAAPLRVRAARSHRSE